MKSNLLKFLIIISIINVIITAKEIKTNKTLSYDSKSANHFLINCKISKIILLPSNDNKININIDYNGPDDTWNNLFFEGVNESPTHFRFDTKIDSKYYKGKEFNLTITFYIPKAITSITLNNNIGDITTDKISLNDLTITNNIGNFYINSKQKIVTIRNNVGNININHQDKNSSVIASTNTGNIELTSLLNDADFKFEATTNIGNITVYNGSQENKIGNKFNKTLKSGKYPIVLSTNVGNIVLKFKE